MRPTEPQKPGPITQALIDAVEHRRNLISTGMTPAEADQVIGQDLKRVLANPRALPWRFYCPHCRDTGWVNITPSDAAQERLMKLYGSVDAAMGYVVKCDPCAWNQMQREQRRKARGDDYSGGDDDFVAAGNTKRGFKRLGR